MAPPFKVIEFDIMYGEGISKIGEIIDLGVELGIINKAGSWFSYNGTKLGQGRDAVRAIFLDNPDMQDEIELKIRQKVQVAGVPAAMEAKEEELEEEEA